MTVVEVEMRNLGRRLDEHLLSSAEVHKAQVAISEKLDARLDRMELNQARLLAVLAGAVFIGQLLAPTILKLLGAPS